MIDNVSIEIYWVWWSKLGFIGYENGLGCCVYWNVIICYCNKWFKVLILNDNFDLFVYMVNYIYNLVGLDLDK